MKYLLLAILSASYGFACRMLEVPLTNAMGFGLFVCFVALIFALTPSRKQKPRHRLPKSRSTSTLSW